MRTIETQVFLYGELGESAKVRARDWWRESSAGDTFFAEAIIDDLVAVSALMGLEIGTRRNGSKRAVFWSGFSSQGDGACFEGRWDASDFKGGAVLEYAPLDLELQRISGVFGGVAVLFPAASFTVRHRGRYQHENCTEFDFSIGLEGEYGRWRDLTPAEEQAENEAEEALKEAARGLMRWLYRSLEKEWDFQNSDEQIAETIVSNGYEFNEMGDRV